MVLMVVAMTVEAVGLAVTRMVVDIVAEAMVAVEQVAVPVEALLSTINPLE